MMMVIIIIIIIIFTFYHNIEDVPELTKSMVPQRMKTSAVTHTAVYQWNKMNTGVQILVHQTTVCSCVILSIDAAWFGSLTNFYVTIQPFP